MAVQRDNPYGAFNFKVTADRFGEADSVQGGFSEVSGLGIEVTVADYRNGNDPENHARKIPLTFKSGDVTCKRGLIGTNSFFAWIKDVRDGVQANMRATVTIELLDEAHSATVMTWRLTNAFPSKYTGPPLKAAGGTEVAMEELVLSYEKLDVE